MRPPAAPGSRLMTPSVTLANDDVAAMSRAELVQQLKQLRDAGLNVGALNAKSDLMRETLYRLLLAEHIASSSTTASPAAATEEAEADLIVEAGGSVQPCSSPQLLGARSVFLRGFGGVYICAFASYWLQYPGCLGANGMLPVGGYFERVRDAPQFRDLGDLPPPLQQGVGLGLLGADWARGMHQWSHFPSFLWLSDMDTDVVMEGTALLGMLCGGLAVGGMHHASVFLCAFLCYLSLFVAGQTFLSFQWDIFLLETGASLVLYAPWFSACAAGPSPAAAWLLRAQWVKFMVMSGTVKITADCPTWRQLTALEFHFASTVSAFQMHLRSICNHIEALCEV